MDLINLVWVFFLVLGYTPVAFTLPLDSEEASPQHLSSTYARSTSYLAATASPIITASASLRWNPELKRQDMGRSVVSCGFLNGDPDFPVTCAGSNQACVSDPFDFRGCCNTLSDLDLCDIPVTCIPFSDYQSCTTSCDIDGAATCSDSASPYCVSNLIVIAGSGTLTEYGCDTTETVYTIYPTPTSSSPTTSTSSEPIDSSPVPSGTRTAAPTSQGSPTSTAGNAPPTGSIPTDFNLGATIGGVIGGCVVLAILIYWGYFWRKRKRMALKTASPNRTSLPDSSQPQMQSAAQSKPFGMVPAAMAGGNGSSEQSEVTKPKAFGRKAYTNSS